MNDEMYNGCSEAHEESRKLMELDKIKIGSRVTITPVYSDYHNLSGIVVQEFPSKDPTDVRFNVAFDQTELRKAKRPEIVLKAKSTVYFTINELELTNVAT